MRALWPDLSLIRQNLRSDNIDETDPEQIDESKTQCSDSPVLELPPAIADLISRTVLAQQIGMQRPVTGDIVLISTKTSSPVAFCLRAEGARSDAGKRWQGWLASSEVDYATDKDVLIEPDDGVADPIAGMVQTWNPLTLEVPDVVRILARLSPYRLSIIEEVANERGGHLSGQARPGRIAIRVTASGRSVLTGSPLGVADDPRHEYQEIYRELAGSVSQQEEKVTARTVELPKQEKLPWWSGLGWFNPSAAVAAMVVCGVLVFKLLPDSGPGRQMPEPLASKPADPNLSIREQAPTQVAQAITETPVAQSMPPAVSPNATKRTSGATEKPNRRDDRRQARQEAVNGTDRAGTVRPDPGSSDATKEAPNSRVMIAKSSLLIPLKDPSALVLAMRSGNTETSELGAFEIGVNDVTQIDRAVDFLQKRGFKVIRVDEQALMVRVLIETRKLGQQLEDELSGSGFFIPKAGGHP